MCVDETVLSDAIGTDLRIVQAEVAKNDFMAQQLKRLKRLSLASRDVPDPGQFRACGVGCRCKPRKVKAMPKFSRTNSAEAD
jgi:hypothetical protein